MTKRASGVSSGILVHHDYRATSNGHYQRMSVSVVACPRFEPTIRQVSEFRRTIVGNIVDLRRVGKSGSGLPTPCGSIQSRFHDALYSDKGKFHSDLNAARNVTCRPAL